MAKVRTHNPNRNAVLKEYGNLCAVCRLEGPEVHHIDENPANHEINNLIPLCPNFHRITQHSPYKRIEPSRLRLFRIFKEPKILLPQFKPIFTRMTFFENITKDSDAAILSKNANDLIEYVLSLEMGGYFSKKLSELIKKRVPFLQSDGSPASLSLLRAQKKKDDDAYIVTLTNAKDKVYGFLIEQLQSQQWNDSITHLCGK